MSEIYGFNIVLEAKLRTAVAMTKKYHPDWTDEQRNKFLRDALEYTIKKESGA